jgi:hypothetical protein
VGLGPTQAVSAVPGPSQPGHWMQAAASPHTPLAVRVLAPVHAMEALDAGGGVARRGITKPPKPRAGRARQVRTAAGTLVLARLATDAGVMALARLLALLAPADGPAALPGVLAQAPHVDAAEGVALGLRFPSLLGARDIGPARRPQTERGGKAPQDEAPPEPVEVQIVDRQPPAESGAASRRSAYGQSPGLGPTHAVCKSPPSQSGHMMHAAVASWHSSWQSASLWHVVHGSPLL